MMVWVIVLAVLLPLLAVAARVDLQAKRRGHRLNLDESNLDETRWQLGRDPGSPGF